MKKEKFYSLLDEYAEKIFAGIAAAAQKNEREFAPSTIPNFSDRCDEIFDLGLGMFDADAFNEWLYKRDLKHLFEASSEFYIKW